MKVEATQGDRPRVRLSFETEDGAEASVQLDQVTLRVRAPDGTVETFTGGDLTLVSSGVVERRVEFAEPGSWVVTAEWDNAVGKETSVLTVAVRYDPTVS